MPRRRKDRDDIKQELDTILHIEREILHELQNRSHFPAAIHFTQKETNHMNPTAAGQTQVFTCTLTPAGSAFPTDTAFTATPNDSSLTASVDATGLVVTISYPEGWVESTTTPLSIAYQASSASAGKTITATITPSAPVVTPPFPDSVTFQQTT